MNEKISNTSIEDAFLDLLSSADIADMAGVSRARVSQWRNSALSRPGLPPFPAPERMGSRGPLFDRKKVTQWLAQLTQTDSRSRVSSDVVEDSDRDFARVIWNAADYLRGILEPSKVIQDVMSLAVLRSFAPNAPLTDYSEGGKALLSAGIDSEIHNENVAELSSTCAVLSEMDGGPEDLMNVIESAVDELIKNNENWLDILIGAAGRNVARSTFDYLTTEPIVKLIASFASVVDAKNIYDPAIGTGALVSGVIKANKGNVSEIFGQDIDDFAAGVAFVRLTTEGKQVHLKVGDSLSTDGNGDVAADIVIADPPVFTGFSIRGGESSSHIESNFANWLELSVKHTKADGIAIVTSRSHVLTSTGSDRLMRKKLIESGKVSAIFTFPRLSIAGASQAIWILTNGEPRANVLLVDLEVLLNNFLTTSSSRFALPKKFIETLEPVFGSWWHDGTLVTPADAEEAFAVVVDSKSLADEGYRLDPAWWIHQKSLPTLSEAEATLANSLEAITEIQASFSHRKHVSSLELKSAKGVEDITLRTLRENESIEILRGRTPRELSDRITEETLPIISSRALEQESVRSYATDGELKARPGDVLVTTSRDAGIVVKIWTEADGDVIVGDRIWLIRSNEFKNVMPQLIAAALELFVPTTGLNSSGPGQIRMNDLEAVRIPSFNFDEGERLAQAFDELNQDLAKAHRLSEELEVARKTLIAALSAGARPSNTAS